MKVFIQDIQSEKYLAHDGTWTTSANGAKNFHFSPCAYTAARKERMRGFRVVFYFEEAGYSIRVKKWKGNGPVACQEVNAGALEA